MLCDQRRKKSFRSYFNYYQLLINLFPVIVEIITTSPVFTYQPIMSILVQTLVSLLSSFFAAVSEFRKDT
jgi:hypothetical protein